MKVVLVSSSRSSGGKLYAQKLSEALECETVSADMPIQQILKQIRILNPHAVDIQFEYRTFGSHLRTLILLPLLTLLLRGSTATFVTIHGVLTRQSMRGEHFWPVKWIAFVLSMRATATCSRLMIVHSEAMKVELNRLGVRNVAIVPHGSGPLDYRWQAGSRANVLFFGFVRPSKGIDVLVRAFGEISRAYADVTLTVAGGPSRPVEASYLRYVEGLAKTLGLENRVRFVRGFVSEPERLALASSAGVLALPYTDSHVEVSGVVHDFAGLGVSLLCTPTPRFSELSDGLNCLKVAPNPSDFSIALGKLLASAELREKLAMNLYHLAETESWRNVAVLRLSLYRDAVSD